MLRFFLSGKLATAIAGLTLGWLKFKHLHTRCAVTVTFALMILFIVAYVYFYVRPKFRMQKDEGECTHAAYLTCIPSRDIDKLWMPACEASFPSAAFCCA